VFNIEEKSASEITEHHTVAKSGLKCVKEILMATVFDPPDKDRLHSQDRQKQLPPGLVLKHLNLHPGETLLDIGAGTGYFSIPAAAELIPYGRVIAADISDEMLGALKERAKGEPGEIECLLTDIDRVPLEAAIADAVLLAFVFYEMPDGLRWLREVRRLLKEGGRVAIVEWDTVPSPGGPPQEERLSALKVLHMASETGFSADEKIQLTPYHYLCLLQLV